MARPVRLEDFATFDLVLAMDRTNQTLLTKTCPETHRSKRRRVLGFSYAGRWREVLAPYRAGLEGFEPVLDQLEEASRGLLDALDPPAAPRIPRACNYL